MANTLRFSHPVLHLYVISGTDFHRLSFRGLKKIHPNFTVRLRIPGFIPLSYKAHCYTVLSTCCQKIYIILNVIIYKSVRVTTYKDGSDVNQNFSFSYFLLLGSGIKHQVMQMARCP